MKYNTYTLQKAFDLTAKYLVAVHEEKIQLRKKIQNATKKCEELELMAQEYYFWSELENNIERNLQSVINAIVQSNSRIIITEKCQLVAFTIFFARNDKLSNYRIINDDEINLKSFPADDEFCKSFYKAYCLEDIETIKELYNKNYT